MAKLLEDAAPPFCLSVFGTDNRFNFSDVIGRWDIMNKLAEDAGVILPIGNYITSATHLQTPIEIYSKDKHFLTQTDISPEDKINFNSVKKMCSPVVIEMLKNIPDSQGTIAFLKVMNDILLSFLDKSIALEDRIYKIWYSLYFLRIWRYSILNDQQFTLKNNFITTNSYSCIELSAHSLIILIKKCRDNNYSLRPSMFIPWSYSNQACEEMFRTARSMTSTYSTMINFSMNNILKRLTRIQLLNSIQNDLHENQKDIIINELKNNNTIEKKHNRNFINFTKVHENIYSVESKSDNVIDSILTKSLKNAKKWQQTWVIINNLKCYSIQIYEDSLLRPQYLSNAVLQNLNGDLDELEDELMDENLSSSVSMTASIVNDISEDTFKDLSNISEFDDFGSALNFKDFSISDKFLNTLYLNQKKNLGSDNINSQTEFVNVSLDEDSMTVVKNSSLC
ncbi:hypothetical protein QTP88_001774 [Uroleucon formosanum]